MNRLLNLGAARGRRRMLICLSVSLTSLPWALCAQAGSIIVPGAYATTEGIAMQRANLPPVRFQMLYEAAEFSTLGGPVLITGIAARPHATWQSGPAAVSGGNMDIWMSTTNRTTSTLSTTFAANRGADHTLVASYDPVESAVTTENLPGPGGTKQFDVIQMVTTPFRYDPAAGGLLLEIRTDGTTLISGSEFYTSACSTGSSCPMRMVISINAPDATSGVYQNAGEINLLLYEPVLAGDYSRNGVVDAADYTVWRDTLGSTFDMRANGDNSGASAMVIDAADYDMWRAHFGETTGATGPASADASIPEPATLALVLIAAAMLSVRRRTNHCS